MEFHCTGLCGAKVSGSGPCAKCMLANLHYNQQLRLLYKIIKVHLPNLRYIHNPVSFSATHPDNCYRSLTPADHSIFPSKQAVLSICCGWNYQEFIKQFKSDSICSKSKSAQKMKKRLIQAIWFFKKPKQTKQQKSTRLCDVDAWVLIGWIQCSGWVG